MAIHSEEYVIKRLTSALVPEYDLYGKLISRVYEGTSSFLVNSSPLQIMEHSAQYYGHCLKGAMNAAKLALGGKIKMGPVKVSGNLGMYWFPSKSPNSHDCSWFALCPYMNVHAGAQKVTDVALRDGHTVSIPITVGGFERKIHRTQKYKDLMENRCNEKPFFSYKALEKLFIMDELSPYHLYPSTQKIADK